MYEDPLFTSYTHLNFPILHYIAETDQNNRKRDREEDEFNMGIKNASRNKEARVECIEQCRRCRNPLLSSIPRCGKCRRAMHPECRKSDELDPASILPTAHWFCRVCSVPATSCGVEDIFRALDTTPLDNEVMNFVTFLFHRVRELERVVDDLVSHPAPQASVQVETVVPDLEAMQTSQTNMKPSPPKTILLIGDNQTKSLRRPLRELLPNGAAITVAAAAKSDIDSMLTETERLLSSARGPVMLVLNAGYAECMEFEKSKFLEAVLTLSTRMRGMPPGSQLHVLSIPLFSAECKMTNDLLAAEAAKEDAPFVFLNLSITQRAMVEKGSYCYTPDVAASVAHIIARRVRDFLGVKLRKPKVHTPSLPANPSTRCPQRPSSVTGAKRMSRQQVLFSQVVGPPSTNPRSRASQHDPRALPRSWQPRGKPNPPTYHESERCSMQDIANMLIREIRNLGPQQPHNGRPGDRSMSRHRSRSRLSTGQSRNPGSHSPYHQSRGRATTRPKRQQ